MIKQVKYIIFHETEHVERSSEQNRLIKQVTNSNTLVGL